MKKLMLILTVCMSLLICGCQQKEYKQISNQNFLSSFIYKGNVVNCHSAEYCFYTDQREIIIEKEYYDSLSSEEMSEELKKFVDAYSTKDDGTIFSNYYGGISVDKLAWPETNSKNIVLEIPETINGKKVIKLGGCITFTSEGNFFSPATHLNYLDKVFLFGNPNIKSVKIPKHLKEISFGNFYGIKADNEYFLAVEEILVDKENPYYSSVNGVLFDKKQETLLFYPELKKEKEYEVPDLVKVIEFMDFSNTKLQSVKIGKNVKEIRAVFDKNTVIKGYENSYAQKWANENGYEFSIL